MSGDEVGAPAAASLEHQLARGAAHEEFVLLAIPDVNCSLRGKALRPDARKRLGEFLAGDAPEERDFNMWDGRLDELAIFNHALTADQVLELYELTSAAD